MVSLRKECTRLSLQLTPVRPRPGICRSFRRECLFKLGSDLAKELEFCAEVGMRAPNRASLSTTDSTMCPARSALAQELPALASSASDCRAYRAASRRVLAHSTRRRSGHCGLRWVHNLTDSLLLRSRLGLQAEMLELDSKNYHVWAYRQWLLQTFGGWREELAFIERLVRRDVRNNSAWNQRHFVSLHDGGRRQ
jgi:hypothetical protein